jgi:hypothetical protein
MDPEYVAALQVWATQVQAWAAERQLWVASAGVFFSALLAGVTVVYVRLTHGLVKEARQQRLNSTLPVLAIRPGSYSLEWTTPRTGFNLERLPPLTETEHKPGVIIANIGVGPALGVDIYVLAGPADLDLSLVFAAPEPRLALGSGESSTVKILQRGRAGRRVLAVARWVEAFEPGAETRPAGFIEVRYHDVHDRHFLSRAALTVGGGSEWLLQTVFVGKPLATTDCAP